MRERALPSSINQAIFTREFVKMAEENGWKYNFIEAFDQPWKRVSEGAVGGYWGLFDADRGDKHVLHGFVSNLPMLCGSSLKFCLSLVGYFIFFVKKHALAKNLPIFLSHSFGGAVALCWQVNSYLLISRTILEYFWGFACVALAFIYGFA